ncbi:MAG: hypothetical protein Q8N80_04790 [Candidatus Omnitrophota bacterium]|nr:hypothetical protein [Candidatus Omnitrophota bacterium]
MSIINEALKKTEEYLQKNAAKDNLLAPKPAGAKPFLLYILILLAGLSLGNFIFNLLSHELQTTQTQKLNALPVIQTTNSPPAAALPSQPPEEKKPAELNFVLNGIFFSDNDGYALVNNQIVRENDYVDGAKVGLITTNTVELDNAGQRITLSTHR